MRTNRVSFPVSTPLAVTLAVTLTAASVGSAGERTVEIDWSGQYKVRAEGHFDADLDQSKPDRRTPVLQRVRIGADVKLNDRVRFFAQIQDARAWGDEASTASNEGNLDLHQGYIALGLTDDSDLTVGRQAWSFGDQRLIGAFEWNIVGRAFDGAKFHTDWGGKWLDAFYARVNRFTEPGSDEVGRDLFGLYTHFSIGEASAIEPYLLGFHRGDDVVSEIEEMSGNSNVFAYGALYKGKYGATKATAELVGQTGEVGGDDLSAFAFAGLISHRLGDDDLWFEPVFGFDWASGDEDPTDGKRQEFFNFFPTNHIYYGYLDLFGWRNIVSPWGGAKIGGHGHTLFVKVHSFSLDEAKGRWSSAGGATLGHDPTGESGTKVGTEFDIVYQKKVFDLVRMNAGYAYFTPSEFAEATRGSDPAHFVYVMATVGF